MKIKISNKAKVEAALNSVQSSRMTRTIDYNYIVVSAHQIMKYYNYDFDIPKSLMNCTIVVTCGAGNYPNSYKHTPMGTCVCIQFIKGVPYLVDVDRIDVRHQSLYGVVRMDDEMKQRILSNVLKMKTL